MKKKTPIRIKFASLALALTFTTSSLAQEIDVPTPRDPADLSSDNVVGSAGFKSRYLSPDWRAEIAAGPQIGEVTAILLNDERQGSIASLTQSLSDLIPGQLYVVEIEWRPGTGTISHAGPQGASLVVQVDDAVLARWVPGPSYDWRVERMPFVAPADTAELTIRGDVNLPSEEVVVNWIAISEFEREAPEPESFDPDQQITGNPDGGGVSGTEIAGRQPPPEAEEVGPPLSTPSPPPPSDESTGGDGGNTGDQIAGLPTDPEEPVEPDNAGDDPNSGGGGSGGTGNQVAALPDDGEPQPQSEGSGDDPNGSGGGSTGNQVTAVPDDGEPQPQPGGSGDDPDSAGGGSTGNQVAGLPETPQPPEGTKPEVQQITEEDQSVEDALPPATRLLAYSIYDQVRGEPGAAPDYFVDFEDGFAKIVEGHGLPFEVIKLGDAQVAFRVADGPNQGQYLSAYDHDAKFTPDLTDDAKFITRAALENSADGFASFESVARPGEYLRHQGFFLKLDPATPDSDTLTRRDATFRFELEDPDEPSSEDESHSAITNMWRQGSGECLSANLRRGDNLLEGAAIMDTCSDTPDQVWVAIPNEDYEGYFMLATPFENEAGGLCLTSNTGAADSPRRGAAYVSDCTLGEDQMWTGVDVPGQEGFYRLQSLALGQERCLEGGAIHEPGRQPLAAFMDTCQNVTGQFWTKATK